MSKDITQFRKGKQFIELAEHSDKVESIRYSNGHIIIVAKNGIREVLTNHPRDLGKGLRCKLIKSFITMGIGTIIIIILWNTGIIL